MTSTDNSNSGVDPRGDLVDFLSTGEHSFHLSPDTTALLSPEGVRTVDSITATCTCGLTIGGLTTAREVFNLIRLHCTPL